MAGSSLTGWISRSWGCTGWGAGSLSYPRWHHPDLLLVLLHPHSTPFIYLSNRTLCSSLGLSDTILIHLSSTGDKDDNLSSRSILVTFLSQWCCCLVFPATIPPRRLCDWSCFGSAGGTRDYSINTCIVLSWSFCKLCSSTKNVPARGVWGRREPERGPEAADLSRQGSPQKNKGGRRNRKTQECVFLWKPLLTPGPSGIKIFNPGIFRDRILPNPGIFRDGIYPYKKWILAILAIFGVRAFLGVQNIVTKNHKKSRDFSFKNSGIPLGPGGHQ